MMSVLQVHFPYLNIKREVRPNPVVLFWIDFKLISCSLPTVLRPVRVLFTDFFLHEGWKCQCNKHRGQKLYLGWKTGLERLNTASSEELAAKAESPVKVRSLSVPVNFCFGEIFSNSVYHSVPKTLNYSMWETISVLHGGSGPCRHMHLLTAALPPGTGSMIGADGKPDPYFRGGCWKVGLTVFSMWGDGVRWSRSAPGWHH